MGGYVTSIFIFQILVHRQLFQTENGSSAVEHAATASAAVAYVSLVKDVVEVSPQVFYGHLVTSGQVQEAILGDESVPSV
ncbi:Protein of unknown function [Gryllus bimaculatus]|nr:Protein of unknown function [Gryllus bimaculatus]